MEEIKCLAKEAHVSSESHVKYSLELLFHNSSPYVIHSAQKTLLEVAESSENLAFLRAFLRFLWNEFDATVPSELGTTCTLLLFRDILKLCYKTGDYETLSLFLDYLADKLLLLRNRLAVSELGLGALLRLLCTVMHILEQYQAEEAQLPFSFVETVKGDMPELLEACFRDTRGWSTTRFIRYKAMMIVYRLSILGCSDYASFQLKLIADILGLPLSCPEDSESSRIVEVSPFIAKNDSSVSPDLQRRGILVLLKTVVKANKSFSFDLSQLAGEVFSKWLSRQLETGGISLDDFVTSLVHFYVDEDDMLLDLLATLLDFKSFWYKDDQYVKFMSAASPLRLFHLFLAALHYDHTVMIDFLISESTGITFLQYLLRCLRLVKDSGAEFLISARGLESKNAVFHHLSFVQAKGCLLNLQEAIHRVHAKKLFPYSASALLERFRQVNITLREID